MARPDPVKECSECHSMVTAQMIPGGGKPQHKPVWRFKCEECGHEWEEVVGADDAT